MRVDVWPRRGFLAAVSGAFLLGVAAKPTSRPHPSPTPTPTPTPVANLDPWKGGLCHHVQLGYGGIFDGIADDTTSILNALTAAGNAGGGVVETGAGKAKYTQNLPIPDNVIFRGSGHSRFGNSGATVLLKSGNFEGITVGNDASVRDLDLYQASGGGDGIHVVGSRSSLYDVTAANHGGVGIRIGNDGNKGNANVWKMRGVCAVGNVGHGVFVQDGYPNANAGNCLGLDSRSNGGDGLNIGRCIDDQWYGVMCASNRGWGVHIANGSLGPAHGHTFWVPYLEANTLGAGLIDSGVTDCIIWGSRYNPGVADGWVNNGGGSNLILGKDAVDSTWRIKSPVIFE